MMKKDSDYSLMGSIGFSMLIAALALTPFNGSIALFIKRFLLICGFLLGITSTLLRFVKFRSLIFEAQSQMLSQIWVDRRIRSLFILQIIFALIALFVLDVSIFFRIWIGGFFGSLAWLVLFCLFKCMKRQE